MAAARLIGVTILAATVSGCMVGPDYKRPVVTPPDKFRGDSIDAPAAASLADERWWQLFDDETLQELIRTALQQNDDLKLAAARILEAQSQLGITSADQYPQVSAGPGLIGQRPPAALGFPSRSVGAVRISVTG